MAVSQTTQEIMDDKAELQLTPMIDVSFLILIFFMCLPFKTLEGKLQAFLPTDKGINPTPQEPPNDIKVSVHIVAREFRKQPWGPKGEETATMPTKVKFKFGDHEEEDIRKVAKWIRDAHRAAEGSENARVLGEIKAAHRVPHKFIVAVLNKFAEAGLEKVDFFGTALPTTELRRLKYLPYPVTDYVGVSKN